MAAGRVFSKVVRDMGVKPPTPTRQDRRTKYLVSDEQLDELLEEMLQAGFPAAIARTFTSLMVSESVTDGWCQHCDGPVKIRYPDWRGYRGLAELILNYLRGKPTEKKTVTVNVTTKNITEMGPDERQQYRDVLLQRVSRPQLPSGGG